MVGDPNQAFGTECCAGCYFSAGACLGFKRHQDGNELVDESGYRLPVFDKNGNFDLTGNANRSGLL
jgi:hypothetical protein